MSPRSCTPARDRESPTRTAAVCRRAPPPAENNAAAPHASTDAPAASVTLRHNRVAHPRRITPHPPIRHQCPRRERKHQRHHRAHRQNCTHRQPPSFMRRGLHTPIPLVNNNVVSTHDQEESRQRLAQSMNGTPPPDLSAGAQPCLRRTSAGYRHPCSIPQPSSRKRTLLMLPHKLPLLLPTTRNVPRIVHAKLALNPPNTTHSQRLPPLRPNRTLAMIR